MPNVPYGGVALRWAPPCVVRAMPKEVDHKASKKIAASALNTRNSKSFNNKTIDIQALAALFFYQPSPMCSGKYTAMPTTIVPKMPRFQKKYNVAHNTAGKRASANEVINAP